MGEEGKGLWPGPQGWCQMPQDLSSPQGSAERDGAARQRFHLCFPAPQRRVHLLDSQPPQQPHQLCGRRLRGECRALTWHSSELPQPSAAEALLVLVRAAGMWLSPHQPSACPAPLPLLLFLQLDGSAGSSQPLPSVQPEQIQSMWLWSPSEASGSDFVDCTTLTLSHIGSLYFPTETNKGVNQPLSKELWPLQSFQI